MDFVVASHSSLWSETMEARDIFSRTEGHWVITWTSRTYITHTGLSLFGNPRI